MAQGGGTTEPQTLAFQAHLRVAPQLVPERRKVRAGAAERQDFAAEFALHRARVGRQIVAVGQRRFQPRHRRVRLLRVGEVAADYQQFSIVQRHRFRLKPALRRWRPLMSAGLGAARDEKNDRNMSVSACPPCPAYARNEP